MWEKKNKEKEKNLVFVGSIVASSWTLLVLPRHFEHIGNSRSICHHSTLNHNPGTDV
jgi:hypothetical protein